MTELITMNKNVDTQEKVEQEYMSENRRESKTAT
jgi:hypothetical protein